MRVTFFTAVINVEIGSISGRGDQISDELFITTDKEVLKDLLSSQTVDAIGDLEHQFLQAASAIIYSRRDVPDNFDWFEYISASMRIVKMFFNVMWLGKDNAANSELGFLSYSSGLIQRTHSTSVAVIYNLADGSRDSVNFSRKELQEIRSYHRGWVGEIDNPSSYGILDTDQISRPMRAFYWVQAGRSAAGLGQRVACFCTALESLFATSSVELTHQLAERTAIFLAPESDRREEIYRQVKRAYGVRSKVIHGDVIKQSRTSELVTASQECDELLRKVIQKVVADREARATFAGTNDTIERYFLRLLFK